MQRWILMLVAIVISVSATGEPRESLLHHATLEADARRATTQNASRRAASRRKLTTGAYITGHFIRSHTIGLIIRPIRSAGGLLSLTASATVGLIRDTALDTVLFPRLDERRIPSNDIPEGMDLEQWEAALDRMTNTRRTHGSLDFLVDGEAFFDRLTTRIAESQHTIKIRTYIFDNDDFALQIADLIKARSADVSVEILVDGLGTLVGGLAASTSVPEDFISPVSMKSYLQADSNVTLRMLGNTWLAGDHTKTYIFDDETAFLGGMNIGREYRYDWHDLMVELSGEVVDQLNYDLQKTSAESRYGDLGFLKRIKRRTSQPLEKGRAELRLLYTKPHDAQIYRAQLAAIRRSNRYIYVQNAYLSDDRILYELAKARLRGVDVRVIVPSRPDNPMMDRSNVLAINTLKRYGVRVYIYPGMTHVKAAIYDGWACFGTANFDKLSFKVNKEVNIGTSDPQIVAKLKRDVFEVDFARSREVSGAQETRIADYVYESIVDLAL